MDPKKKTSGASVKYFGEDNMSYSKIHKPMSMKTLERMHETSQEKKPISEHFKFLEMVKTKHRHKAKERNDNTTRTINMIENTFRKKYDGEYIKKICRLLKKKDKNYSKKRNNLDRTQVGLDENNNLYLTLPKFDYGKRIRDLMKDRKDHETHEADKKKIFEENLKNDTGAPEKAEDHRSRLERLIPEFYVNQKTLSDDSEEEMDRVSQQHSEESSEISELDEKQKNALFDRMKTRNKFFAKNNNSNNINYNYNNKNEKSEYEIYDYNNNNNYNANNSLKYDNSGKNLVLPFLPTKVRFAEQRGRSQTQTQTTPVRASATLITDFEIKNAAASSLYRTKAQPLGLIDTDPTILNIKKIREKFKVIKDMEKTKEKILGVDLFKYDKKKWQKKNLRESERIILGIKDFEDRRNEIMRKIYSTMEVPKIQNKEKKPLVEAEEN